MLLRQTPLVPLTSYPQTQQDDAPMRVRIKYYDDKSYELKILAPETVWYVKRCAGIKQCANRPGHEVVGAITLKHVYHIAEAKSKDFPHLTMEQVCRMIISSCRSYGIKVVAQPEDAPEYVPLPSSTPT